MSWCTQAVGRLLIDLPRGRPQRWIQSFDAAAVRRLHRPMAQATFWVGVEGVRAHYAGRPHRQHDSCLAHHERHEAESEAVVIGYASPHSFWAPELWRFVHRGAQHAYEWKVTALDTENQPPSPELWGPHLRASQAVLAGLQPLPEGELPRTEGLCLDGACIAGDTGPNAQVALTVEIAPGTHLGVGYQENRRGCILNTAAQLLQAEQVRAEAAQAQAQDGQGLRDFALLRWRECPLGGLTAQEFITRSRWGDGHVQYRFMAWVSGGLDSLLTPTLAVHLTTPARPGQALADLPPESDLLALWDSVLPSVQQRPHALPGNQRLRDAV